MRGLFGNSDTQKESQQGDCREKHAGVSVEEVSLRGIFFCFQRLYIDDIVGLEVKIGRRRERSVLGVEAGEFSDLVALAHDEHVVSLGVGSEVACHADGLGGSEPLLGNDVGIWAGEFAKHRDAEI